MSCFSVPVTHIDHLISAAYAWEFRVDRIQIEATGSRLGQMLVDANSASVNYRYRSSGLADLGVTIPYAFTAARIVKVTPIQVLKAIACLDYQSCEFPEWEESNARRFLLDLENYAIQRLEGYDSAKWVIE